MRFRYLIVGFFLTTSADAQLVREMTPDKVQEAAAWGAAQKSLPAYEIRKPGMVGSLYKPVLGYFTTPFMRVAQAAYRAKKQYAAFTLADATPAMLAPELQVYGMAQVEGAQVSNVQSIVITSVGQRDATRPTSVEEAPVEFQNMMGMKTEGKSLLVVFPLDALKPGREIHVIYDRGVHDGRETRYCEGCAVEVKPEKIR